jgi:hypothetical protein
MWHSREPVQPAPTAMKKFAPKWAKWRRLALLTISLIGYCGFAGEPAAIAENTASTSEAEQQTTPPLGPPATIDGFRQALFGMSEEQVRQAVRKEFPAAAGKISSAVHPSEKTTVLSVSVPDLLPNSGNARISYIFGYRSKKLIQVNVVWTSEGNAASDETLVGTANSLRDYFSAQNYKPDTVIANRQLAENMIVVFRASDLQGRMVLLVLSGVAATARGDDKKGPRPPPLTLELSYIEDAAHPDVFRIGKGQF